LRFALFRLVRFAAWAAGLFVEAALQPFHPINEVGMLRYPRRTSTVRRLSRDLGVDRFHQGCIEKLARCESLKAMLGRRREQFLRSAACCAGAGDSYSTRWTKDR